MTRYLNPAMENEGYIWQEVDAAAQDLARQGYEGNAGDPLPFGLSLRALHRINADIPGFRERVRRYRIEEHRP